MRTKKWLAVLMVAVLIGSLLSACGSNSAKPMHDLAMAHLSEMPAEVQAAEVRTREAYQFAFANREILQHIPCYCGCKDLKHESAEDCFIQPGNGQYEAHALNCQVCVDITQDVMQMTREGKSPGVMKAYIDRNYSRFGPSTMN